MSGTGRFGEDTRYGAVPLETLESSPVKSNSPLSAFFFFFFYKCSPPTHTPREKSQPERCRPLAAHVSGRGESWRPVPLPRRARGIRGAEEPPGWSPAGGDSFSLNCAA